LRCAYREYEILSGEPGEAFGWVALGLDDQEAYCPGRVANLEKHFAYDITRAEIMEYLSQTYGAAFVEDLIKHLS
jgi:hypothetical protein